MLLITLLNNCNLYDNDNVTDHADEYKIKLEKIIESNIVFKSQECNVMNYNDWKLNLNALVDENIFLKDNNK